jgi:hypothetical protein
MQNSTRLRGVAAVLVVSPAATGPVGEPGDVTCFDDEWRRRAVEMATNVVGVQDRRAKSPIDKLHCKKR